MKFFITIAAVLFAICLPVIAANDANKPTMTEAQPDQVKSQSNALTPEIEAMITQAALEKAERYYSHRFSSLQTFVAMFLGAVSILITIAGYYVGIKIPALSEAHREKQLKDITELIKKQEADHQGKFTEMSGQIKGLVANADKKVLKITGREMGEIAATQDHNFKELRKAICLDKARTLLFLSGSFAKSGSHDAAVLMLLESITTNIESGLVTTKVQILSNFKSITRELAELKPAFIVPNFFCTVLLNIKNIKDETDKLENADFQKQILDEVEKLEVLINNLQNPGQ